MQKLSIRNAAALKRTRFGKLILMFGSEMYSIWATRICGTAATAGLVISKSTNERTEWIHAAHIRKRLSQRRRASFTIPSSFFSVQSHLVNFLLTLVFSLQFILLLFQIVRVTSRFKKRLLTRYAERCKSSSDQSACCGDQNYYYGPFGETAIDTMSKNRCVHSSRRTFTMQLV